MERTITYHVTLNDKVKQQSEQVLITVLEGGGDTPLYEPYRYMLPQRVWFLHRFGLKMGIYFGHCGLESVMVFEETAGVYERIYRFNSK